MSVRAIVAVLSACIVALAAWPALAGPRQTRTSLSPDTIEVGDTTTLSFTVSPGEDASDPELVVPNGVSVVGKMVSPSFQITVVNGQISQAVSARAIFRLRAAREGTFALGAPSVLFGASRVNGDRSTLRVVARGTLPRQQQPDPLDPFGMFGRNNPFQQFDQQQPEIEPTYPVDPRFALPAPRDDGIFLHATLDKTHAVVGEQVTLSIWVYADVTERDPELGDPHEVGTSEFLRQALLNPNSTIERSAFARAGRTRTPSRSCANGRSFRFTPARSKSFRCACGSGTAGSDRASRSKSA